MAYTHTYRDTSTFLTALGAPVNQRPCEDLQSLTRDTQLQAPHTPVHGLFIECILVMQ